MRQKSRIDPGSQIGVKGEGGVIIKKFEITIDDNVTVTLLQ